MEYHVDRLTSTELILSEDFSVLSNILDYDEIGDVVDRYPGVKIYRYSGAYSVIAIRKTESITLVNHLKCEEVTTSSMTEIPSISYVSNRRLALTELRTK